MKFYALLLSVLLSFTVASVFGQNKQVISGYVINAENNERIINAYIKVSRTNITTTTNEDGKFYFSIEEYVDTVQITCSHTGYYSLTKKISSKNKTIVLYLIPSTKLDSIIVAAERPINERTEIGTYTFSNKDLKLAPSLLAENDFIKAMQLLPGIMPGTEGSSNLVVRGGDEDQNLVMLDEVPIYHIKHLGGLLSVFNSDIINTVKVYKAGFPAQYTGRLSSIVDIQCKNGNTKKLKGNIDIGLLSSKIFLNGPVSNKTRFVSSLRIFYWDLIIAPFYKMFSNDVFNYNFYDFNTKISHNFSNKTKLYFNFYIGNDKYANIFVEPSLFTKFTQKNTWGNTALSITLKHSFSNKFFSKNIIYLTKYNYKYYLDEKTISQKTEEEYTHQTDITDFGFKTKNTFFVNNNINLNFGINSTVHIFEPGKYFIRQIIKNKTVIDTNFAYTPLLSAENSFFAELNININKRIKIRAGSNLGSIINNKIYYFPQIRFLSVLKISNDSSIKFSFGQMLQTVHLLTSNTPLVPYDIWITTTEGLKPATSRQFSLAYHKSLKNNLLEFSLETYYKQMSNLIAFKENQTFLTISHNWQNKILNDGTGEAYGIELLLQKKQGKLTGWLSYCYSRSYRLFKDLNNSEKYPFKYDRPHSFNILGNYKINKKINISASWVYYTGQPTTLPLGYYNSLYDNNYNYSAWKEQNFIIFSKLNEYRMRAYHRLDVAVNFSKKVKRGTRTWTISIYNVYNRQNPYFYYTKYDKSTNNMQIYQQSLFPIIPSVSYSLKF